MENLRVIFGGADVARAGSVAGALIATKDARIIAGVTGVSLALDHSIRGIVADKVFWWVAAVLTMVLGIVLFASALGMWINGVIFVTYGLAIGLAFKILYSRGGVRKD
ncbi:hypothetical protein [Cryobacterium ruanii]|uniref:Uncharacterized protein n=1 Tax=Cryobacterium ruanii TaxID=1259197 RepID=A0A4R9AQ24_9MICO|nr:hypothetical protein [Cryobacterium ruanii]TFD67714.1 hypothetical protein E3T47_03540 [Cryobacterium ruanii]